MPTIMTSAPSSQARKLFFGCYAAVFLICAIAPFDRGVWWAENAPILILVGLVAAAGRWHAFSPAAYALMLVLPLMHTIGGHYTFERVPFAWVTELLGFERNHYDRLAHFSVGFYAYAIAELLYCHRLVRSRSVLLAFPVCVIFTVAALYELFEWQYAVLADPAAGIAVLGSQGDIWDAQQDMLADGLGGIAATLLFALSHRGAAAEPAGGARQPAGCRPELRQ
jgi:putative membrane protein